MQLVGDELLAAMTTVQRVTAFEAGLDKINTIRPIGRSCGAGATLAYIAPDGAVWPCVMFPMSCGNLREQSFSEIWYGSRRRTDLRDFTNADRDDCLSCAASGACQYCVGEAYKRTGDYRKAPPIFHHRTRTWVKALGVTAGETWPAEKWATVPSGEEPLAAERPRNFVFPIHRPQKGGGLRVHKVVAETP